jgi:hypothetical protein
MQPLRFGVAAATLAGATLLLLPVSSQADAISDLLASTFQVPAPRQVHARSARSAPLRQNRTALVPFETAPFPYDGTIAGTDKPFLNVEEDGRRGHKTPFGRLYWEDETYSDQRVLLHIPKGFDLKKPSVMIVYFHGHGATLRRDVVRRQRLPAQITASGVNAVLVAPQLAVDAADSSAGKFWEPGAFGRFVGEAAQKLAKLHGDPRSLRTFASMPIVIVAYSGGYLPAAWCAAKGGLMSRVRGVILLDALYGEVDKFASWIARDRSAFFVSTYLGSTESKNAELERVLADRSVAFDTALEPHLGPGSVTIFPGGENLKHRDLVTHAWVENPIADLLRRLRQYRR